MAPLGQRLIIIFCGVNMWMMWITWGRSNWFILVAVPENSLEAVINRFDHFKTDLVPYLSHIHWFAVSPKNIVHQRQQIATNAGWV